MGKLVNVSVKNVNITSNIDITGLPKPKLGYAIFYPMSSGTVNGYIQYSGNWSAISGTKGYANFMYISE